VRSGAPFLDGAAAWEDVTLRKLDDHTILAHCGPSRRRLGAHDLGLVGTRSGRTRILFEMLMAFCENGGGLKTRRFGSAATTKSTLSRLRGKLRAAFGIDGDPFLDFKAGMGWRARFRVSDGEDEMEDELSPGAREALARAGKLRRR
jgi:hypothetical protein